MSEMKLNGVALKIGQWWGNRNTLPIRIEDLYAPRNTIWYRHHDRDAVIRASVPMDADPPLRLLRPAELDAAGVPDDQRIEEQRDAVLKWSPQFECVYLPPCRARDGAVYWSGFHWESTGTDYKSLPPATAAQIADSGVPIDDVPVAMRAEVESRRVHKRWSLPATLTINGETYRRETKQSASEGSK